MSNTHHICEASQLLSRVGRDGGEQSGDAQASHGGAQAARAVEGGPAVRGSLHGAAERRLDLSLGHIRTIEAPSIGRPECQVDFVAFGPYLIELDYGEMVANVAIDSQALSSRSERRENARKVDKLLKTAKQSGMRIEGWPL